MLGVVTFKYDGCRPVYTAREVNTVYRQFQEHLTIPHRFICATDDPTGIECETVKLWPKMSPQGWTHWADNFQKLKVLKAYGKRFGDQLLVTDLDVWIRGNIDHLITDDDFRVLKVPQGYCSALFLCRPGARRDLAGYNPKTFMAEYERAEAAGKFMRGSDQAFINARAKPDERTYGPEDGVELIDPGFTKPIPDRVKVAIFYGTMKPWKRGEYRAEWYGEKRPPAGENGTDRGPAKLSNAIVA